MSGMDASKSGTLGAQREEGSVVAVAVDADGPLCGVALLGSSGAGKSRLALELVESCPWRRARLVADDIFVASLSDGRPLAAAPQAIKGLIEVRGFGPAPLADCRSVVLSAAFRLAEGGARVAEPSSVEFAGRCIPLWPFNPARAGASGLRVILRAILAGQTP